MTAPGAPRELRQLRRQVLRDDVYDAVLDMLMEQRLKPGSALGIDRLARELGVSPTPVREALAHLEHSGLVRRTALKGYTVAPQMSPEQMAQLMDARAVVELAALDRALGSSTDLLPRLRQAHRAHLLAVDDLVGTEPGARQPARAMRAYFEADWGFHLVILEASGNAFLQQMLTGLGAYVHRMLQQASRGVYDWELAVEEHGRVLAAAETHDAEAVRDAMRDHLSAVGTRSRSETAGEAPVTPGPHAADHEGLDAAG